MISKEEVINIINNTNEYLTTMPNEIFDIIKQLVENNDKEKLSLFVAGAVTFNNMTIIDKINSLDKITIN